MIGAMRDDDLVPRRLRAMVAQLPPTPLLVPSPLPPLAVTWYTMGGCWSLALALHEETGFPIELYSAGGRLKHAYVVDGEYALDATGRNPLRLVRLGGELPEQVETEEQLVARLELEVDGVTELLTNAEVRECATRAARVILGRAEKSGPHP